MKKIVFTGGPSGGKTSIIEILQREFGPEVDVVDEAATILYQGGFPRLKGEEAMKCIQRAIYRVQVELEAMTEETSRARVLLCDRGTLDGIAYWPGDGKGYLRSLKTTRESEAARYDLAFHLRTPKISGYRHGGTRIESQRKALQLDRKIEAAWSRHPRRIIVEDEPDFLVKVRRVLEMLEGEMPEVFGRRPAGRRR